MPGCTPKGLFVCNLQGKSASQTEARLRTDFNK